MDRSRHDLGEPPRRDRQEAVRSRQLAQGGVIAFRWTASPRRTDDVGALISALARSSFDPVVPDVPFVTAMSCFRR